MLQQNSLVKVADNSGFGVVKVIRVYGKRKSREAVVGNLVLVASTRKRAANLPKGKMMHALVLGTKAPFGRSSDGTYVRFPENSVLLVNRDKGLFDVMGTRIKTAVPLEVLRLLNKKSRSKCVKVV